MFSTNRFNKKDQTVRTKAQTSRFEAASLKSFSQGKLLCTKCKHTIPLEGLEPLQMIDCPKCNSINFIPMRIGSFWLYEPLGGGGMGSVYKAMNDQYNNEVFAVKVLARSERLNPSPIQALLNEARIAEVIGDHECLVKCYAHGYEDGEYYCALELVQGERLDKMIDRLHHMAPNIVMQVALHILAAEQHIYNCGYLYRDMKPENIIFTKSGYAVLIDYGLCLPRTAALDPNDEFISGSPYYLPPERLLGMGESAYSEIYSLGMVMYYAITGSTYYDANEVEALAKKHVSKLRISVKSKLRNLDPAVADILKRMISQEPEKRFQTFAEVAEAIMAYLEDQVA